MNEVREKWIHPGEILEEEFLTPLAISQNRLAIELRLPVTRINAIVKGKRGISADTAIRLAKYFDNSPGFWLNLQNGYDLRKAEEEIGNTISKIEKRPF